MNDTTRDIILVAIALGAVYFIWKELQPVQQAANNLNSTINTINSAPADALGSLENTLGDALSGMAGDSGSLGNVVN